MLITNKDSAHISRYNKIERKIDGVDNKIESFKISTLQKHLAHKRRIEELEKENEKLKEMISINLMANMVLFFSILVISLVVATKLF